MRKVENEEGDYCNHSDNSVEYEIVNEGAENASWDRKFPSIYVVNQKRQENPAESEECPVGDIPKRFEHVRIDVGIFCLSGQVGPLTK